MFVVDAFYWGSGDAIEYCASILDRTGALDRCRVRFRRPKYIISIRDKRISAVLNIIYKLGVIIITGPSLTGDIKIIVNIFAFTLGRGASRLVKVVILFIIARIK